MRFRWSKDNKYYSVAANGLAYSSFVETLIMSQIYNPREHKANNKLSTQNAVSELADDPLISPSVSLRQRYCNDHECLEVGREITDLFKNAIIAAGDDQLQCAINLRIIAQTILSNDRLSDVLLSMEVLWKPEGCYGRRSLGTTPKGNEILLVETHGYWMNPHDHVAKLPDGDRPVDWSFVAPLNGSLRSETFARVANARRLSRVESVIITTDTPYFWFEDGKQPIHRLTTESCRVRSLNVYSSNTNSTICYELFRGWGDHLSAWEISED